MFIRDRVSQISIIIKATNNISKGSYVDKIKKNIEISAHFASKQALSKIEKAGGEIKIIE